MASLRIWLLLIAFARIAAGDTGKALLLVREQRGVPQRYSCTIDIIAVDGHRLSHPSKQISLSPGVHRISLRVTNSEGHVYESDGMPETFRSGHHHSVFGHFQPDGLMKVTIGDDDIAEPPGLKPRPK